MSDGRMPIFASSSESSKCTPALQCRDLLTGRQMDADEVASWAAEAFKREDG